MSSRWKQAMCATPGVGISLVPKLACPACWPAYAGLLSALGLGFLVGTAYLLPLTIAFLALALSAMAFKAKARRGYRPLLLGLLGGGGILAGKFAWESSPVLYASVGLLVAASIWNSWPRQGIALDDRCPVCAGDDAEELAKNMKEAQ